MFHSSDQGTAVSHTNEIDLHELLRFEPEKGLVWLKNYRMVMLSACALGALRKELIKTLGWEQARGLMKRFGYAAGLADGLALAERFPEVSGGNHMELGPALHALEGIAKVVRIPERTEVDLENGRYHVEAWWENSFEAEQHLELLGTSEEPVCWTLVGYAVGHASSAAGRPIVVTETECRAMGHKRCRFTATLAEHMPELALQEEKDYAEQHLPAVLQELRQAVQQHQRTLRSKEKALARLRTEVDRIRPRGRFIGSSEALTRALDTAQAVAPYDATALLLGESGTGKELMARLIHRRSPRKDRPFVAVNCSALPENLQEAELFGHAKGAFTGAISANEGVFEAAHGGTLLLDEIGDLALTAQTKILRALQEGEVKRLGETRTRKVNLRIIAATNRDLEAMVRAKTFREDLYYRLSVITITLPPLRERGNDVLLLAEHFLSVYAEQFRKDVRGFSRETICALAGHSWPGNVREMENVIQRAVILAKGEEVILEDLPPHVLAGGMNGGMGGAAAGTFSSATPGGPVALAVAPSLAGIEDEGERIRRALDLAGGVRHRAAHLLGMSRTTLWRKMKALGGVSQTTY